MSSQSSRKSRTESKRSSRTRSKTESKKSKSRTSSKRSEAKKPMDNKTILKIFRHGESCTNIMTIAYAVLISQMNPYVLYGNSHFKPSIKNQLDIWYYLSNVSKDPPLNNSGMCDLINIYEKINEPIDDEPSPPLSGKKRPTRVYCSNMCRAMMTAMIIYPHGGEDGLIHVVPWIHEHGGWCNEMGPFGKITGFTGAERLLTKTLRNPRDFDELQSLIKNINKLYQSYDKKFIDDILGNDYSSEMLVNHEITAELKAHPAIDTISQLEDPDPTKFIEVVLKPELPEGNTEIGIVSHGYTMRSGCKSFEVSCDGWCNYFACVKPKDKTSYTQNLDTSLGPEGNVENGAHLEVLLVPKKPMGKNLEKIKEKQMKYLFTKKELTSQKSSIRSSQRSSRRSSQRSSRRSSGKKKNMDFMTGFNLFATQLKHEIVGSSEKIERVGTNKEPVSVRYQMLGNKDEKDEKVLKKILKKHQELNGKDADIFFEVVCIYVRNLLYPWIYFSVGDKDNFHYQTLQTVFCNSVSFEKGMKRWNEIKTKKLLSEKYLTLFKPYLE
jgi:hypothetical protein